MQGMVSPLLICASPRRKNGKQRCLPGRARAGGSPPTAAGAEPCHSTRRLWSLCWVNLTAQEAAIPCSRKICNSYLPSTSGNQFDQRSMPIRKSSVPKFKISLPHKPKAFRTIMQITDCVLFLNILTIFIHMGLEHGMNNYSLNFTSKTISYTMISIFFFNLLGRVE